MKKCLIVVNTHKKESHSLGKKISEYLKKTGIQSDFYSFDGFSEENPFAGNDFVITLGGDGTVLFAARGCASLGIPVFPVNLGEFGFIASVQVDFWKTELDLFLSGNAKIVQRSMVQAVVVSSKDGCVAYSGCGLNDIVVTAKTAARTIITATNIMIIVLFSIFSPIIIN